MAYKIAVASSDGIHVDLKFGEVTKFLIYEVTDEIRYLEERSVPIERNKSDINEESYDFPGCGGDGSGCNGSFKVNPKVSLLSDCRCIVCRKIGFQARKQFEKKAISVFDVECEVKEALEKIEFYYGKIDKHKSR